jgi:hypothetical protein
MVYLGSTPSCDYYHGSRLHWYTIISLDRSTELFSRQSSLPPRARESHVFVNGLQKNNSRTVKF